MSHHQPVTNEDILDQLLSFVQMVSERFSALELRMDKLEARMDQLELRMDQLEDRLSKLEKRLDFVEHDIADLKQTSYRQEQSLGRAIAIFEMAHQRDHA